MSKKGFILCACQGRCPGLAKLDIFRVLSEIRQANLFDYVCLHPQLCSGDGEEFLTVHLSGGQTKRLYVAACDPQMQKKMYRDAFEVIDFDGLRHASIDIRNKSAEEAVAAIRELVKRDSRCACCAD